MIVTHYKKGFNLSFNRRVTSVQQPHQGWRTFSESLWVGAPLHCALHDLTRVLWDGFRQDLLRLRSGIPPLLYGRPRLQKENIKSSSANIFKVLNKKSFEEEKNQCHLDLQCQLFLHQDFPMQHFSNLTSQNQSGSVWKLFSVKVMNKQN